jgi:hypothetical protein
MSIVNCKELYGYMFGLDDSVGDYGDLRKNFKIGGDVSEIF